jgi:hypothetical protein
MDEGRFSSYALEMAYVESRLVSFGVERETRVWNVVGAKSLFGK